MDASRRVGLEVERRLPEVVAPRKKAVEAAREVTLVRDPQRRADDRVS